MKKIIRWMLVVLAYLLIPVGLSVAICGDFSKNVATEKSSAISGPRVSIVYKNAKETVSLNEFIAMAMACEMENFPDKQVSFSDDFFRAFSVVLRTNIMLKMNNMQEVDSDKLDIEYLKKKDLKDKWGLEWEEKYNRLLNLTEDTGSQVLKCEGNLINAYYHCISVGKTLTGEEAFGVNYSYLKSVNCERDKESIKYCTVEELRNSDILKCIKQSGKLTGIDENNAVSDIQIVSKLDSGYVTRAQVGDLVMSGEEFRELLGLASAFINLEYKQTTLKITTRGVGNDLGMSLNYANQLAVDGSNYRDILGYFYENVSIDN